MSATDCGKRFGKRGHICVRKAGHWGRHSTVRTAQNIGVRLRSAPVPDPKETRPDA